MSQAICKRIAFGELCERLFPPPLLARIYEMVRELNRDKHTAAVIIGGRSWNYQTRQMHAASFDDVNIRAATVNGNIDLVVLNSQDNYYHTPAYGRLLSQINGFIDEVRKTVEEAGVGTTDLSIRTNATTSGLGVHSSAAAVMALSLIPHDGEETLLLYAEIGAHPINAPLFKEILVDRNYPPPGIDTRNVFLSKTGLLLFYVPSTSVAKRTAMKQLNVDAIRSELFRRRMLAGMIDDLHQADINHAIVQLMMVLYPEIYQTSNPANYVFANKQGSLLDYLLVTFNATIHVYGYDGGDSSLRYDEFKDMLGSHGILDSRRGGTPNGDAYPTLRQFIQHLFAGINYAGAMATRNKYTCRIVGGDAVRHYDPSIQISADIDGKLVFPVKAHLARYAYAVNFLVFILHKYVQKYDYFRFARVFPIRLGAMQLQFRVDSTSQSLTSRPRWLPKFAVPLASLDVRVNASFLTPVKGLPPVKLSLSYAPLDLSVVLDPTMSTGPPGAVAYTFDSICKLLHIPANPETRQMISGTPLVAPWSRGKAEEKTVAAFPPLVVPVVPLNALISDVQALVSNPTDRIAVGKHDKDVRRLASLTHILNADMAGRGGVEDVRYDQIADLEQLWLVHDEPTSDIAHILMAWGNCVAAVMSFVDPSVSTRDTTPEKLRVDFRQAPDIQAFLTHVEDQDQSRGPEMGDLVGEFHAIYSTHGGYVGKYDPEYYHNMRGLGVQINNAQMRHSPPATRSRVARKR